MARHTKFSRKVARGVVAEQVVAANVDAVFMVVALDGDFNPRRLERYLVMAWESGARPVIVLRKADLCPTGRGALSRSGRSPGVPVHAVSSLSGEGFGRPGAPDAGRTVALLGSSGVGKSTLVNRLAGEELLRTQEVRAYGRSVAATRRPTDS